VFTGETIEHRAYFGDEDKFSYGSKPTERTLKVLRTCGWDGVERIDEISTLNKEVHIRIANDEKNGKTYPKVKSIKTIETAAPKEKTQSIVDHIMAKIRPEATLSDESVPF